MFLFVLLFVIQGEVGGELRHDPIFLVDMGQKEGADFVEVFQKLCRGRTFLRQTTKLIQHGKEPAMIRVKLAYPDFQGLVPTNIAHGFTPYSSCIATLPKSSKCSTAIVR